MKNSPHDTGLSQELLEIQEFNYTTHVKGLSPHDFMTTRMCLPAASVHSASFLYPPARPPIGRILCVLSGLWAAAFKAWSFLPPLLLPRHALDPSRVLLLQLCSRATALRCSSDRLLT